MKRILISQRVDIIDDYGERRDALDQRWASFLRETGALPFPLPNDCQSLPEILKMFPPDGILLTGGNNPVKYGGNAPERDEIDAFLLDYAVTNKTPLIGVCRGMQSIILYFGGSLKKTEGHIGVWHSVKGRINRIVNSYHSLTTDIVPPCLEVISYSMDGMVESAKHSTLPIMTIMWHPEREEAFNKEDIELFRNIWNRKAEII
ncbi:gamma-glutamyl-gamma-aminobutyrate hydrolase family protein [Paenibacillus sp. NPDC057967]|uniref:gamma-glutamyl-gamma-aminobutyrate hydrolase family protein n=1 Tax=Paenibacillus sp. NPDC057967 TaxID=3346293 RepID=UPI0036DA6F22